MKLQFQFLIYRYFFYEEGSTDVPGKIFEMVAYHKSKILVSKMGHLFA